MATGVLAASSSTELADMSFKEGMRAPNSVLEEAARTPVAIERKAIVNNQDQVRKEQERKVSFFCCLVTQTLPSFSKQTRLHHIYVTYAVFWPQKKRGGGEW